MFRKSLIIAFLLSTVEVFGQPSQRQRIEDSVIGWEKLYSFKDKQYKPMVVEGQTFSPYQLSLRDSFITWVQRTYIPVGSQGTVFQKEFTTVQRRGPVPQGIGADFLVWSVAFDGTGKKLERIPETWIPVYINTNILMGINDVTILRNPKQYYFTMPKQNYNSTFNDPSFINIVKDYGLHKDERFKKYMVYFDGANVNVVLIPGNQLPIIQLTKGELLQALEDAIPGIVAREKADRSTNQFEQNRIETEMKPRWIKTIANMKEKYKNRFSEMAYVTTQYGPTTADLYSPDEDFFVEGKPQYGQGFAVYRFDNAAIEKSKQDKPLWITVSWQPQKQGASSAKAYNLHKAMLNNFNFEYIYDYFFNPDKVKGIAYRPLNESEIRRQNESRKEYWKVQESKMPEGVFFADNFSANADGNKPAGWFSSAGNQRSAVVVSLKERQGKWVQLGHMNEFSPSTSLKKTLPENFTMEFDVVTDEFSFRTGGAVTLRLSSYPLSSEGWENTNAKGASLELTLTAGNENDNSNNNYSGSAKSLINSNISNYEGNYNYNYPLREFTNKKTGIHVKFTVKNKVVTVFINDQQVMASTMFKKDYCTDCVCNGVPPGTLFRILSFKNTTQNWSPDGKSDEVHVYISNVKITKD